MERTGNKDRCNTRESERETTSINRYPDGTNSYGCLDMCGNVWESKKSVGQSSQSGFHAGELTELRMGE